MSNHITKRHCHYCHQPATTAFYLADQKGWSCVDCYFKQASRPSKASSGHSRRPIIMATEGAIDSLAELAGVA